jgi:Tol biopolymer transport system component
MVNACCGDNFHRKIDVGERRALLHINFIVRIIMTTDKAKRKNTPRSRRILWALVIIVCLIFGGFVAFPYAESHLSQWLENDPFTRICNAGHLELAYDIHETDGWQRLYTVRGDGTDKVAVRSSIDSVTYRPDWSPDGRWLIIDTDYLTQPWADYSVINLATGDIAYAADWEFPQWSPDSRYISFSNIHNESFSGIRNPTHTNVNNRLYTVHQEDTPMIWSPDSSHAIYRRNSMDNSGNLEVVVVYIDNDFTDEIVYQGQNMFIWRWSPDSRYFAFTADTALWVADFDEVTGHLHEVRQLVDHHVSDVRWSLDSTKIAYLVDNQAFVQDIETSEIDWQFDAIALYGWSENGLIITTIDSNTRESNMVELRVADIDTQTVSEYFARSIMRESVALFAQWTPNGQKIFYTFNDYDFYLTSLETIHNGLKPFGIPASYLEYNVMWTPDNRYLTYKGYNQWLYLVDLETYESCRVVKVGTLTSNYDWRLIPEEER